MFPMEEKKLLSIRIAEKQGRWFLAAHERGYWLAPRTALWQFFEIMLDNSYRLGVRPRSTSNEFPSQVINRLSQIIIINLADYSSDTICDLSTVKRRDWTRHEHYNMLYMWRIHNWVKIKEISLNFVWLFSPPSSILSFLLRRVLA